MGQFPPFNMIYNGGTSYNTIKELYELSNYRLYSIQYLGSNAPTYSSDHEYFVYTAVNQRYSLNGIKEGLDVLGTDCYPAMTSDDFHGISTVATKGIRNISNAKAIWGIIQIYDKTVNNLRDQNAPTELVLKNMMYQVIAASAMGLFALDYGNLWSPKMQNPPHWMEKNL